MELQAFAAIAIPGCVAALVWFVRLEGRVNSHDDRFVSLTKTADERHKALTDDLTYIRQRIDYAIGRRHE